MRKAFAQRMADVSHRLGDPTHLHGVFVANTSCLLNFLPVDQRSVKPEDKFHVDYVTENRLSVFKADLLHTLARFPRFEADLTPALEDYFAQPKWSSCAPKTGDIDACRDLETTQAVLSGSELLVQRSETESPPN